MIDLRTEQRRKRVSERELEGVRVLVVDDDLGICRSLREILEADGCKVEVAGDGVAALAALGRLPFDVVLTDVVMPNMDGYQLYTAIQERRPELPVLMMTAFHYDKDHIIKRSRMAGLKTVIFKKPVDPDRLRHTLIDAVGKRRGDA
jgi:two-component system capsular synthesis sensor histidine kinase RcsC